MNPEPAGRRAGRLRATGRTYLLAGGALALVGAGLSARPAQPEPQTAGGSRRIVAIAHRGAHKRAPENTLAAFRAAIKLGCDYVEMDVRRTRDGELVILHDRTVDARTNGKGAVEDLTLSDIRALDAGVRVGREWKGERVPTFADALRLCRNRIKVYVDNKAGPPAEVMAAIGRERMDGQVVIYDSVERLRQFRQLRPKVWIMPDHPGRAEEISSLCASLHPETLDGNLRRWTAEQVEAAHRARAQVWVDCLGENDNEAGFRRAVAMGVDAIQTDEPELLLAVLRALGRR